MSSSTTRAAARVLAPAAALVVICVLDQLLAARSWPIPAEAALDEPAHLLTAWLFLAAAGVRGGRLFVGALAGAVLVDLDHLPLYLGASVTAGDGRPVTHSLAFVLLLLGVAWAWRSQRSLVTGLALGVGLHMVRDIALGPGVPALWPLVQGSYRVAWSTYIGALLAVSAVATWRAWRDRTLPLAHPVG